jgi:hypothetical protein
MAAAAAVMVQGGWGIWPANLLAPLEIAMAVATVVLPGVTREGAAVLAA